MLRRYIAMAGAGMLVLGATATPALANSQPNKGQCIAELARAGLIGPGSNPGHANIIVGTDGDDTFDPALFTDGPDLVCGFGGNDTLTSLGLGDVFLGGQGDERVDSLDGGTFYGGDGNDSLNFLNDGTFFGGDGQDSIGFLRMGTFNGDAGNDSVGFLQPTAGVGPAIFNGGDGNDTVSTMGRRRSTDVGPTFDGGAGDDLVIFLRSGVFNGGPGTDSVAVNQGGTFNQD